MTTEGLIPDLTLTWDSEGAKLQPQQSRVVTVQLTAKTNAQEQEFNFTIIITLTAEGGAS